MTISTNPMPTIYRNVYDNTGLEDRKQPVALIEYKEW